MTDRRRAGVSLLELLVAMVLGVLLLGSAIQLFTALTRAVERSIARADRMEAVRTAWVTVERELRAGLPARDWEVTPGGVLELRAFRGVGRVCVGEPEPGVYGVAWRGDRLPVPGRDSVMVLYDDGGWRAAGLTGWWEGWEPCAAGTDERAARMEWDGPRAGRPLVVRVFERGSYSFHNRAFRYERGEGGRQPLTPEIFASSSRFEAGSGMDIVMRVEFLAGGGHALELPFRVGSPDNGVDDAGGG